MSFIGLLVGFVLQTPPLLAQPSFFPQIDSTYIRFGAFGGYGIVRHEANFVELPGLQTCCPAPYGRTDLLRFGGAGVLVELPIAPLSDVLIAALRLGYTPYGGTLRAVVESTNANLSGGAQYAGGKIDIQHQLETGLAALTLTPMLSVRPFKWLSVLLGAQIGYNLTGNYRYNQRILTAGVVDSTTKTPETNTRTGTLPNAAALGAALTGGIAYEIPLNRKGTVLLALEAFATFGLTSPVGGVDWRIHSLHAGASLRFSPHRTTELSESEVRQLYEDSLRASQILAARSDSIAMSMKRTAFSAQIRSLVGVFPTVFPQGEGNVAEKRIEKPTIRVERFNLNESRYVLNYVFFGEDSWVLPSRYKRLLPSRRDDFNEDSVAKESPLAAYYHVLNIIGKRLADNPQATVTLVGCTANTKREQGNMKLARSRAEAVQGYWQEVWRVAPARVTIQERGLPEQISPLASTAEKTGNDSLADANADAEHRRVEILCTNPDILRDVRYGGTKQVVEPPVVEVNLDIVAGAGLKQWSLDISQANKQEIVTLASPTGTNPPPTLYRWDLTRTIPVSAEPVSFQLSIDDQRNNKIEAPIQTLAVEQIPARFNLFLTGFDHKRSSQDSRLQKAIEYIASKLQPASELTITGFAEALGETQVQQTQVQQAQVQAQERVANVAQMLSTANPAIITKTRVLTGTASDAGVLYRYDNGLPEGRIYNRCVLVEVKNPIR